MCKINVFVQNKRFLFLFSIILTFQLFFACSSNKSKIEVIDSSSYSEDTVRVAPAISSIPNDEFGELVRYGKYLVENTAIMLGPEGKKGKYLGNKMNCTNCHLDAGTRPYGLNFLSTHGRYPQFRARENQVLDLAQRVNNCIERPHNGKPLPLDSKEMIAFVSYIKWLGAGVPVNKRVLGDEGVELEFPNRAANPSFGKELYTKHCIKCHQENGGGVMLADNSTYQYPPLWGKSAYQPGSSMFRVIKTARFIKANMPHLEVSYLNMKLTDEQALDISAYINSDEHVRPKMTGENYPNIKVKAVDYPYGPFDDPFSEQQHKFGPFQPIVDYRKSKGLYVNY